LISCSIVIEALQRLVHPPEMSTDRLLLVSFVGLIVNLVGIFAFNHGHAHGGHGHDHGHHHGHDHGHGHSANMQGVFLHIMADTLGSAGVIVSTLLIQWFGWTGFDPIASLFIAILIIMSVIPLIRQSASVLMLELSDDVVNQVEGTVEEVRRLEGVTGICNYRFWPNEAETVVGSIHVLVQNGVKAQDMRRAVSEVFMSHIDGLKEICVQVESASSARLQNQQQQKNQFANQYSYGQQTEYTNHGRQHDHQHIREEHQQHNQSPMGFYSPTPSNNLYQHNHSTPSPIPTGTNFRSMVLPQPTFAAEMPISVKKKD
jgi:zinc transporter 5/7